MRSSRKRSIHDASGYICQYCGVALSRATATVDHMVPTSRGGRNTSGNLVSACNPCNNRKGDRTPREAGLTLISPVRPGGHGGLLGSEQRGVY